MKKIMYLLSIGLVLSFIGCGARAAAPVKETVNPPSTTVAPAPAPAPTPAPPKNKPTMTKAEFDKIQNGMTLEEVIAIVGGPGELLVESGTPGDQMHTVGYKFDGDGVPGANAQLMFQGNKLNMKAQAGLK